MKKIFTIIVPIFFLVVVFGMSALLVSLSLKADNDSNVIEPKNKQTND